MAFAAAWQVPEAQTSQETAQPLFALIALWAGNLGADTFPALLPASRLFAGHLVCVGEENEC